MIRHSFTLFFVFFKFSEINLNKLIFLLLQASCLPMSIIIVGVGPAEFDGKSPRTCELVEVAGLF